MDCLCRHGGGGGEEASQRDGWMESSSIMRRNECFYLFSAPHCIAKQIDWKEDFLVVVGGGRSIPPDQ